MRGGVSAAAVRILFLSPTLRSDLTLMLNFTVILYYTVCSQMIFIAENLSSARNGPVYRTGTFLFLNFMPALNIYYIHVCFSIFLTLYPWFAFKKYTGTSQFPFRAPCTVHDIFIHFGFPRPCSRIPVNPIQYVRQNEFTKRAAFE
jgi:hypothetical protein